MARPFDVTRLEFTGDARAIAEGAVGPLSASDTGIVIYRRDEPQSAMRQFFWIERAGKTDSLGVRSDAVALRLAPDGNRIAFAQGGNGTEAASAFERADASATCCAWRCCDSFSACWRISRSR